MNDSEFGKITSRESKPCLFCGKDMVRKRFACGTLEDNGAFTRRKFCCRSCSTKYMHALKPMSTNPHASRKRTRSMMGLDCAACGSQKMLCVHHVDENPQNNAESNLQTLCNSCHSFWHAAAKRAGVVPAGRMPKLFGS